jgi:hypothetical protein
LRSFLILSLVGLGLTELGLLGTLGAMLHAQGDEIGEAEGVLNGPFQAKIDEANGGNYAYAPALVGGVVAVAMIIVIRLSLEPARRAPAGALRLPEAARALLRHFSDPQLPTRNSRGREDAGPCPGIIGEMAFDFPFVVRSEDQKHVFAFLQRASEAHDPLGLQRIHEPPVSLPVLLLFERPPRRIGRAVTTHDHKQILHAVPPLPSVASCLHADPGCGDGGSRRLWRLVLGRRRFFPSVRHA